MTRQKKIFSLFISLILCLCVAPITVNAQAQAPHVWIVSAEDGDVFTYYKQNSEKVLYGDFSGKYGGIGTNAGMHLLDRAIDLSAYSQKGFIHLVLYAEKAADLQSLSYLELSSSGMCDTKEIQFNFTGQLVDGWNHLVFPCNQTKQTIDWKYVNYARLVLKNIGGSSVWVEGVFASMTADPIDPDSDYTVPQWEVSATADGNDIALKVQTQDLTDKTVCRVYYDSLWLTPSDATEILFGIGDQQKELAFRATQGGVALFTVQLSAKDGRILDTKTARVTVAGRGWYFGDAHTHSVLSDGMDTLYANFETAYRRGSAYIFATDHNYNVAKKSPIQQAMQEVHSANGVGVTDFLAITANEITGTAGHSLQYFCSRSYQPPTTAKGYESLVQKIRDVGGLYFLAHPYLLEKFYFPELENPAVINEKYQDITGIEIVNGPYKDVFYNREAIQCWDRFNITGYKHYVAIGNTDAHNSSWVAQVRNYLLLDSVNEENIYQAMKNGHLYVSDGAQLRYTLGGAQIGETLLVAEQNTQVTLKIAALQEGGSPVDRIEIYQFTIGEDNDELYRQGIKNKLVIRPQENTSFYQHTQQLAVSPGQFVRVAVYTGAGQAYSNPIWIEQGEPVDVSSSDGEAKDASTYLLPLCIGTAVMALAAGAAVLGAKKKTFSKKMDG